MGEWLADNPEVISICGNLIETANHNMNSAPVVKLESIEDIEARLSVCACGHIAATHDQDALGNLLSCTVKNCRCDHFHYDAEKVAA